MTAAVNEDLINAYARRPPAHLEPGSVPSTDDADLLDAQQADTELARARREFGEALGIVQRARRNAAAEPWALVEEAGRALLDALDQSITASRALDPAARLSWERDAPQYADLLDDSEQLNAALDELVDADYPEPSGFLARRNAPHVRGLVREIEDLLEQIADQTARAELLPPAERAGLVASALHFMTRNGTSVTASGGGGFRPAAAFEARRVYALGLVRAVRRHLGLPA